MKKYYIIAFLLHLSVVSVSQDITISGYVKDKNTGERLIGATINESNSNNAVITNDYGFYNLKLKKGENISVIVSFVGYKTLVETIKKTENQTINFLLKSDNTLDEVIITASKEKPIEKRQEMSVISFPISQIERLPSIGGESDIIKALQLMPGVQSGDEGSSQLHVRGGSPDQNLFLLDDVPLYYVNHLGGFVSTFNTDAINQVKLIKGGFPAKYGERLSSIVDIRMKEGNLNKFSGNAMIGMLATKVSVEGPIKKDTTSYIISVRRMLYDLISRAVTNFDSQGQWSYGYHFYDLNAKINHYFSDKNHIYLSAYLGNDRIFMQNKDKTDSNEFMQSIGKMGWGNRMVAFRWNHLINQKLFSNALLSYTRYRFKRQYESIQKNNNTSFESHGAFNSGIYDALAKFDFEYYPTSNLKLKFGGSTTYHTFKPSVTSYKQIDNEQLKYSIFFGDKKINALENSLYIENEISFGKQFHTNIGLRYNLYYVNKKNYKSFEPRILTNILLGDYLSLKASYAKMQQNIHLLSTSGVGMPVDLWVPATDKIGPEQSQQWAVGLVKSLRNGKYELSLEAYHKNMTNLITYKEGASYFGSSQDWQDKIEKSGKGLSYGIEFLIQKKQGKTNGWLGYTWSKTTRQFENINFGKIYPYKYDRRHDISIVLNHKLNENIDLSSTWVYGTGNAFTLASSHYEMLNRPIGQGTINDGDEEFVEVRYYSGKNNFRMRDFHKLDIGVSFHKQKKRGVRTWNISIYNLYNRMNPYFYFFDVDAEYDNQGYPIPNTEKISLKQQTFFPFFPSISYSYKF